MKKRLRSIHLPRDHEDLKQARRRFVYEEFLLFQLKMQALRKREREETPGMKQAFDSTELVNFTNFAAVSVNKRSKTCSKRNYARYEIALSHESLAAR